MPTTVSRPSLSLFTSEPLRAAGDMLGHLARAPALAPRASEGHVVSLFPGLASNGVALWPLLRWLNGLGYRAMDWGQGFNTGPVGDVDVWLTALKDQLLATVERAHPAARHISMVGWSLGGFYAREIARLEPHGVRRVVTLGTPFNGSRDVTNVAWLFKLLNRRAPADTPQLRARLAAPPPVPRSAIYSRRDGVVAWQSCRHGGRSRGNVRDIEVHASHLGMGWNRAVLGAVAGELARPNWQARAA